MSDSSTISRVVRRTSVGAYVRDANAEEYEDLGSFGWLRGVRDRAIMLELRKRDGRILAIGYAWLERIEFDPSDGIVLRLPGVRVTIKGKSLNTPPRALLEGLSRHRVPWIRESSMAEAASGERHCVIDTLDWSA